MKYRSQWPTFILRSNIESYWLIIPKYDIHTSNTLQDIRQNQLTMKYWSYCLTFILRSKVELYWLIIPKHDVHTSNSLQNIRQNHWTMKCRSHRPIFIYWLIIPKTGLNSHQRTHQHTWTPHKQRLRWSFSQLRMSWPTKAQIDVLFFPLALRVTFFPTDHIILCNTEIMVLLEVSI